MAEKEKEKNKLVVHKPSEIKQTGMFEGLQLNLNLFQAKKNTKDDKIEDNIDDNKTDKTKQAKASNESKGCIFDTINTSSGYESNRKRDQKAASKPQTNIDLLLTMVKSDNKDHKHKRVKISEAENDNEPKSNPEEGKDEPWLFKDIIVKVLQKSLDGGKFYKQKGRVYKVLSSDNTESNNGFNAHVKMISGPVKGK